MGDCGAQGRWSVFNGRFDHAIDDKGRVSIPARFREVLQAEGHDRLYITNHIMERERCLALYPPREWEALVSRIRDKARFDRNVQLFQTFYIGGAHEVEADRQGRILIPPKLREFARLDREATFSAQIDHFQLWDRAALGRVLQSAEQLMEDPEFVGKLNI
ncbi:MAG TPA: division/cell wall cluster transcriptional repressor MraZ [Candidatus Binataceae bacterium]|nr:division/cell wall cluster transcriptional repressor MraZ [Candidatus Binataceae bacterium]